MSDIETKETDLTAFHELGGEEWKSEPASVKEMRRLETILKHVAVGYKVNVLRLEPSWCKGHLETLDILEEDDPVDIQYLIDTWGGHKLHLKVCNERGKWVGGSSLALYSYPPRVHGELLEKPSVFSQSRQNGDLLPFTQGMAGGGGGPTLDMTRLLDLVAKNKNADAGTLLKVFELAQAQAARAVPAIPNPMEQMLTMLAMFKEMKSIFGGGDFSGDSGENSMLPLFGDILGKLLNKPERPTRRTLVAPTLSTVQTQPTQPTQPTMPTQSGATETLTTFADKLASLSPQDAAEVVLTAVSNMPENRRKEAMSMFLSNFADDDEEEDLDESSISVDDNIDVRSSQPVSGFPHKVKRRG